RHSPVAGERLPCGAAGAEERASAARRRRRYLGGMSSVNRPPRTTATYVRGWSTSRPAVMLIRPRGVSKFLIVLSASVILLRWILMSSPPVRLARRMASQTTCAPAYACAANWLGSLL